MTTRFKTSLAAGLAVLTLAAGAPMLMAAAQDQQTMPRRGPGPGGPGGPGMRGPGGPMGIGPGFRELDLSDDQRAQIKQIAESHRDEFRAAGEKVRAAHDGLRALVDADTIDEGAIRAKSTEIAAAEAEVMILNAKVRKESMQVLTSEQLAKLKELRTAREGQTKQRRRGK
jgi:protein CpxP